jgi:beta-glucanase (GH16 family)
MKTQPYKLPFIVFLAFLNASGAFAQTSCYQLVWSDEFSGTSLDLSKWTQIVGEGGAVSGNAELQYYTNRSQNTQVSNGTLKIIALQETYGGNAYTSARMQTKNQGDWLYGKMEARIKLPVAKGMWPAFWMLPTDNIYGIWPRSGEMDIMELIGKEPSNSYATIHYGDNGTDNGFGTHTTLASGTFADDFHLFSIEWSPNLIKIFLDGALYFTATPTNIASPNVWRFDKRFYILLNLAIGGSWAGAPDGTTTFPQTMEVDYVRVYQKIADIEVKGATLVEPSTNASTYFVPSISGVTYQWSVSGTGNTIASGQNTNQVTVNWGSSSGTVSVLVSDGCSSNTTLNLNVTVSPNLWNNYGFEQNYVSWDPRPAYGSNVSFTTSTTDFVEGSKAACAQVLTAGANPWDIQLSRTNLSLTAGTSYTVRFKAKADAARPISASFITSTFSTIGNSYRDINLTTSWQQYSITFTPSSSVTGAMFNADLARQVGTYCFDDFVFARTTLLPIELVSFAGQTLDKTNQLYWKTASKTNAQSFEIQRLNVQNEFQTIGKMVANPKQVDYDFVDETPLAAVNYYRLKMIDLDGKVVYSSVISFENQANSWKIYPNPAKQGNFKVHLMLQAMQSVNVLIFNSLGQKVWFQTTAPQVGNVEIPVQLPQVAKGLYFVEINANGKVAMQRVLIE